MGRFVDLMPLKPRNINQFKTKIDDNGRVCTACGVYRLWIDFKPDKRVITKHSSKCKACYSAGRKSKGRKKERVAKKSRMQWLRINEPFVWKSRLLRNRLLTRATTKEIKDTTPSAKELQIWLEKQKLVCYYSGVPLSVYDINVDHKTSLARGGNNKIENLCIASHHMNTAKGNMNEQEFKQLLKLISKWEDKGFKLLGRLKQGHY